MLISLSLIGLDHSMSFMCVCWWRPGRLSESKRSLGFYVEQLETPVGTTPNVMNVSVASKFGAKSMYIQMILWIQTWRLCWALQNISTRDTLNIRHVFYNIAMRLLKVIDSSSSHREVLSRGFRSISGHTFWSFLQLIWHASKQRRQMLIVSC